MPFWSRRRTGTSRNRENGGQARSTDVPPVQPSVAAAAIAA
jgi:hypothetical protein